MNAKVDERRLVELDTEKQWNFIIPFVGRHKDYGRAEFQLCVRWKRSRIDELWLYPKQQDRNDYWHAKINRRSDSLSLCGYEGLDYPNVWYASWCKEHKCQVLEMYVPDGANVLKISILSTLSVGFYKR